jgi:ketosteroid isomerase-like protein
MSIYSPDVVAYDMVPPLRYRGIDAYRKDYKDYFDAYDGPVDVELADVSVVAGKDVGLASPAPFAKSTANGSTSMTMIRCQ